MSLSKCFIKTIFDFVWGVRIAGVEHLETIDGPVVIAANHVSLIDGPLLAAFLPVQAHWGVTKDYALRQPWKAGLDWMARSGCGSYSALDADDSISLRPFFSVLRRGGTVGLFPEGAISATGELGEIKAGALRLAIATNAVVVPVRLTGPQASVFGRSKGSGAAPPEKWSRPLFSIEIMPPITAHIRKRKDVSDSDSASDVQSVLHKQLQKALSHAITN